MVKAKGWRGVSLLPVKIVGYGLLFCVGCVIANFIFNVISSPIMQGLLWELLDAILHLRF